MTDIDLRIKAIDGLVLIHRAIKNVQLYPTSDLTIINSIEGLYLHLMDIIRQDYPSVFAELEKKILLGEHELNKREENTIHVLSLLDIFRGLDIKNVSFNRNLEKEELHILIDLFAKKPASSPVEELNKNEGDFSILDIVEEPVSKGFVSDVEAKRHQGIFTVLDIVEEPVSESAAKIEDVKKGQDIVSAPLTLEEPIAETVVEGLDVKKGQDIVSAPLTLEESIAETAVEGLDVKKGQDIVSVPLTLEEPIAETAVEGLDVKKGQDIVSVPLTLEEPIAEMAVEPQEVKIEREYVSNPIIEEKPITETAATIEEVKKDEEFISAPDIDEEPISESIARIEKIFIRFNALDGAVSALPSEEQMSMIRRLSVRAAEWVEQNKDFSFEYKEICHRLQKLLQDFIDIGFFAEAIPIIDVFSRINNGTLEKDNLLREVSLEVLKNLASDNNIGILIREINTNGSLKSTEARKIIAGFGDMVIKKLLNNLLNATDSKQRISVIHIIEEMGQAAIPAISSSIKVSSPWYYLRNVAYILGRIGNETSVDILQPLLLHKDKRVRKEAFKSINQTGGSKRGEIFLSALPQVDQQSRIDIIEVLGRIKCTEAVSDLQDMIKTKTSMPKDEQIVFHEKICSALGSIGSPEAIKVLSEIAESKSILGIGSYPKEVKYAAQRALASIKRR